MVWMTVVGLTAAPALAGGGSAKVIAESVWSIGLTWTLGARPEAAVRGDSSAGGSDGSDGECLSGKAERHLTGGQGMGDTGKRIDDSHLWRRWW